MTEEPRPSGRAPARPAPRAGLAPFVPSRPLGSSGRLTRVEPFRPDPELLAELAVTRMPFGKYRGRLLHELPEAYLLWLERSGWPRGRLGEQLALSLEIERAGLRSLLRGIPEAPAVARRPPSP